jgi:macrolide transport system ATP-binding/permease protein
MDLLTLTNVSKTYSMGDEVVRALDGVALTVGQGEFIAIMGSSGSGKSTLLNVLGLLDVPDSGDYLFRGEDIQQLGVIDLARLRRQTIGFVFQQFHLLSRVTAWENVALPLIYSQRKLDQNLAVEQLKRVGLEARQFHTPNQMSGGQQQRVAIARALVNRPQLILADEPTGNLDSVNSKSIMDLLVELNRQGITVIMVTHEDDIAAYAHRKIRMADGRIIEDLITRPTESGSTNSIQKIAPAHERVSLGSMASYLSQGFRALMVNKVRTLLSMLGILIGVASVIAMIAIGNGAKQAIANSLSSLGSNLLVLRNGAIRHGGVYLESGATARITLEDANAIASRLPSVEAVAPLVSGRGQVTYKGKNWSTALTGTTANYETIRSMQPELGRFFTDKENQSRKMVAVLGKTVVKELFGESNPIGEFVKINRKNFQVIGVLPNKGGMSWRDQDDVMIIPISTAMKRLLGKNYVESIEIQVTSQEEMESTQDAIVEMMLKRHRISPNQELGAFQVRNMADIQAAMSESSNTMSMLLAAIAGISLLVGGIGIMNIMLVSVTERTREIGLRKAVGATAKDILMQFLVESVVVSLAGGIVGVIVGWGVSLVISLFTEWTTALDIYATLGALGFSVCIGIIFGLYPARRAALLNPIEALRYD